MMQETLTQTVRIATGIPDAQPRPGQIALVKNVEEAIRTTGHTIGVAPTGVGKALDIDTPIPTPSGWTRMGDLRDGDRVFAEDGSVTTVLKAHDFQYGRPCYDVVFSDGSRITADEEHLWAVTTRATRAQEADRRRGRFDTLGYFERLQKLRAARASIDESGHTMALSDVEIRFGGLLRMDTVSATRRAMGMHKLSAGELFDVRPVLDRFIANAESRSMLAKPAMDPTVIATTAQMSQTLRGQGDALNYAVDVAGILDLPRRDDLELPPYILGAWLGDGHSHISYITSEDDQIPSIIRAEGFETEKLTAKYLYAIKRDGKTLTGVLEQLGVRRDKHIPTKYLRASGEQRLELLQGLMDTDGTINAGGRAEIAVCSEELAEGIYELVCSLGIKATFKSGPAAITEDDPARPGKKRRRPVGTRYRIGFCTALPVFRLPRKAALLKSEHSRRQLRRYITEIIPVESRPVRCILVDSPSHLFLAGKSMIPTHNTFSLLAPAMVAAARFGQRTVVSTESLSLMAQVFHKDAPVAAAACEKVTGTRPEVALLKGFGNYVCGTSARDSAEELTGTAGTRPSLPTLRSKLKRLATRKDLLLDGRPFDAANGVPLLLWALSLGAADSGDKQDYEGPITPALWDAVSVGPSECIGDSCPIFDACKPRGARAKAAKADIVITNHSMLAVQAAKGVPVIIGNKTLGEFHIIMVDEAHALPANVRSAGAGEVSSATVNSLVRAMANVIDDADSKAAQLIKEGNALAEEVNDELTGLARGTRPGDVLKVKEDTDPLERSGEILIGWARSVKGAIEKATTSSNVQLRLKARRLTGRLDTFIGNVGQVKLHRIGTARWIEQREPGQNARSQAPYWVACASPVNIAPLLKANLWTAPVLVDEEDEMVQAMREAGEPVDGEGETYPMTVVAVSATLPRRFGWQLGLTAENVDYPSPFDKAYEDSILYIPKVAPAELPQLYPGWRPGARGRFDSKLHQEWAARKNVELVDANAGAALVLSANSAGGKAYAEALRRAAGGRWRVLSQWDGLSTGQLINAWREDESAVLVGTRSFMTGVDAKGRTCSLVTIDRIPRAAGNPVDDARVEAIMDSMQTDKWSADRYVYVEDAALLLEQALGRLIRSVTDFGMAAILDPRMLKTGPVSYPEPTRQVYKGAAARFRKVTTSQDAAEEYLRRISAGAAIAA